VPLFDGRGKVAFEMPRLLHSSTTNNTWFTKLFNTGAGENVVAQMSLQADTAAHVTCTVEWPCSWTGVSYDAGRTFAPLPRTGSLTAITPPHITADPDGTNVSSFLGLAYTQTVATDNRSATSIGTLWRDNGTCLEPIGSVPVIFQGFNEGSAPPLPGRLVLRGKVVWLRAEPRPAVPSSHPAEAAPPLLMTTLYGFSHGYRMDMPSHAIFFVVSADGGHTWSYRSQIRWDPRMGSTADGPGEPDTVVLGTGEVFVVFRTDSNALYWSALSADNGRTWTAGTTGPAPMQGVTAWSVLPQLRIVSRRQRGRGTDDSITGYAAGGSATDATAATPEYQEALVLTGGRPGLFLWVRYNGNWSSRVNIAAAHNLLVAPSQTGWTFNGNVTDVTKYVALGMERISAQARAHTPACARIIPHTMHHKQRARAHTPLAAHIYGSASLTCSRLWYIPAICALARRKVHRPQGGSPGDHQLYWIGAA